MIPKVIHYCWFGGKPLPKMARKCIKSWKRYFPDYEIKEWNESNFDINVNSYVREAYNTKRYAFVSDYARYWILYNFGGVYFDTDVEVIRPFDDIIERGGFMGFETVIDSQIPLYVAPGLGMASEKDNPLIGELLNKYSGLRFVKNDGSHNLKTIVQYTSELLIEKGLKRTREIQKISGLNIYPKDYFNPYDCETDKIILTSNTRSIHYYAGSWITPKEKFMKFIAKHFGATAVGIVHRAYVIVKKFTNEI